MTSLKPSQQWVGDPEKMRNPTVQLQSVKPNQPCLICVLSTARALHVVDTTFARVFESHSLR